MVLWKPLNWVVGIIEDFVQRRAEKEGQGQRRRSTLIRRLRRGLLAPLHIMTERAFEALVASTSITPVRMPRIAVAFVLSEAIAMTQEWPAAVRDLSQ